MTQARVFPVHHRLSQAIKTPGGKTVGEALRAADHRIESIRETCLSSLNEQIVRLAQLAQQGRAAPELSLDGLYKTANEIFGIAATFGQQPLAEAAYGLCDLIELFTPPQAPNWEAVDVHVNGIRLLAMGAAGEAAVVLRGLSEVRARMMKDL